MPCKLSLEAKRLIVIGAFSEDVITENFEDTEMGVMILYQLVKNVDDESIEHLFRTLVSDVG